MNRLIEIKKRNRGNGHGAWSQALVVESCQVVVSWEVIKLAVRVGRNCVYMMTQPPPGEAVTYMLVSNMANDMENGL